MPKILKHRDGQAAFHRLLLFLLRFLNPFLQRGPMSETTRALYSATCKILLVLLHDFPDFLAVYYSSLCDAVPASCIQLQVCRISLAVHASPTD